MSAAENLAKAQTALDAFNERHFPTGGERLDHGVLNMPVGRRRGNIDSQVDQWKKLRERVDHWQRKVDAQKRREVAPLVREAKAAVHAGADLKAQFGSCAEVLWTLSGRWLKVARWNTKSVRVYMGDRFESIPHDQVGGAR